MATAHGRSPHRKAAATLAQARAVVAAADEVARLADELAAAPERAREQVRAAFVDSREERVLAQLDGVPVGSLRDVTRERLRIGTLSSAGVAGVGEVIRLGQRGLEALDGIGPQTATHLLAAAEQVAAAMRTSIRFRIEMDPSDPIATRLLQTLYTLDQATAATERHTETIVRVRSGHDRVREHAGELTGRFRRLLSWGERRRRAETAVQTLAGLTDLARQVGLVEDATLVTGLLEVPMHPIEVWEDFRVRSIAYYALLETVAPTQRDHSAAEGHLPAGLVERVERQPLDTSLLTASLRGYQAFGARFALAQRRVVIGDEMGLGKTVQAIATIAHLVAQGARHALVVCPASVLAGWVREVSAHSSLAVHLVHGADREEAALRWREEGGVAVVSYTGLWWHERDMGTPEVLVVDEAHYVKNPRTNRARAVERLAARVPHVLFLTGTVMENRVEEFGNLVSYLQPELAHQLHESAAALRLADAAAFRRTVAPVYLRRNAEDVLEELPELVQVEEWEEFTEADGAAYRRAVASGSFMGMRRAAFAVERPGQSSKVERLVEIVSEAVENHRKVVVFSFFRDVIDMVVRALGEMAIGPLTGSVPPEQRQRVIDAFTTSERALALVCQIDVGGVGINLQAGSIVILCEPQTKPTTEAQAIARAHRMGQVETVQVHRLLVVDTVDEHLMRILDTKRQLFDAYARRSALAEEVAGAVDVSEAELARRIVDAEQTRLLVDPHVLSTEDAPVEDQPASG
ncbi:DEAD/DEAH box helicase [Pseudactinotalea suaedae]|uniref:DEAD/DEAH box helicase n=1 Tax=Pseudactinotalea suaedae TaxID=1524924 RepID=UPI0012E14BDB|nr:DEAD/DEAH box helicase [Pseudactinotalea suaedae]